MIQDDPKYKKARAIVEARERLIADREKRTLCCKVRNKPHDQKKNKEARKARKRNRRA